MSWLSAGLKRNGLNVLNKIAKPIVGAAEQIGRNVIPGGSAIIDATKAVGNYIPGGPKVPTLGVDPKTGMPTADPNWQGSDNSDWLASIFGIQGGGAKAPSTSGLSAADWLKAIGGGVDAGLDYKNKQAILDQQKGEFERTAGRTDATTAVGAQDRLNRAPMADNAQALLMARMKAAPTTFAPRDFTKGPMTAQTMAAPATGGPQDQMAAARTAAAGYTPGSGGVDTSVLEMLKRKMLASSGMRA